VVSGGVFWGVLGGFGGSCCCIGVRMFLVMRFRLFMLGPSSLGFVCVCNTSRPLYRVMLLFGYRFVKGWCVGVLYTGIWVYSVMCVPMGFGLLFVSWQD